MTVIVSTTRRHTRADEVSGYVYLVDPVAQRVLQRSTMIEPPYRAVDTNPRGGMRGCKGITIRDDQIAIANSAAVFRYDPQWNLLGVISHPSCSAIHDIAFQGDTLWVTSARTDLLLQFSLEGELLWSYSMRDPSPALAKLRWKPPILLSADQVRRGEVDFRNPLTHDQETYDRAHVNSLCFCPPDGAMLVSLGQVIGSEQAFLLRLKGKLIQIGLWKTFLALNRGINSALRALQGGATKGGRKDLHSELVVRPGKSLSAVVRISADGAHQLCLAIPDVSTPSHSLIAVEDDAQRPTALYLNTTAGAVVHFALETVHGDGERSTECAGEILSSTTVTDGFLRGVTRLDGQTFLLGSKGELIVFDLSTRTVKDVFRITDDTNESVYDIKILPPHYATPPASFEEHFAQSMGYSAAEWIKADAKRP